MGRWRFFIRYIFWQRIERKKFWKDFLGKEIRFFRLKKQGILTAFEEALDQYGLKLNSACFFWLSSVSAPS
uniref:Uncharacterized protein n=1 Tax=Solanum lycopersicum TaxID=4081 RepID=A0A3Q7EV16_SOLLC